MASREEMIEVIREKYGFDPSAVLNAMSKVPREKFVSPECRYMAYLDRSVPIRHG